MLYDVTLCYKLREDLQGSFERSQIIVSALNKKEAERSAKERLKEDLDISEFYYVLAENSK